MIFVASEEENTPRLIAQQRSTSFAAKRSFFLGIEPHNSRFRKYRKPRDCWANSLAISQFSISRSDL